MRSPHLGCAHAITQEDAGEYRRVECEYQDGDC
jgi:hypothetical protein